MNIEKKRQREMKVVALMIHDIDEKTLVNYALKRIEKCPMMKDKTFCSQCHIHCYEKNMQKQIKKVMRYSGPRMIFYHPLLALRHALKI